MLLVLWVAGFGCYVFFSTRIYAEDSGEKADAIIVLTGGDKRIEEGLALLTAGQAPYVFISGVYADVTEGEIRAMWKASAPLPDCCIMLGRQAKSTKQNAREVKEWLRSMNFKSIKLVTANYHMWRAELELQRAMPEIEILPHPVVQPDLVTFSQRYWILLFSEYNKILFRWLSFPLDKTQ